MKQVSKFQLLGLIREASWTENAFVKRKTLPATDQMSSRPPSSVSNLSESVKENFEDLESRISPLGTDIEIGQIWTNWPNITFKHNLKLKYFLSKSYFESFVGGIPSVFEDLNFIESVRGVSF